MTKLTDGSTQLADGVLIKPDGSLVLADGTKISADGTVTTASGHKIHKSGLSQFCNGHCLDLGGFCHRDGTTVSQDGELKIHHNDGKTTEYHPESKQLELADGSKIDPKGTKTPEGTKINVDHSVDVSDGTHIRPDYSIIFADGTNITPDGRISTPDGWNTDANLYHHGIEFTSERSAGQAAADAISLVSALSSRMYDGSITYGDIDSLRAAFGDLGILSRVFTQQGNLAIVQALMAASSTVQGALSLAVPAAQAAELARQQGVFDTDSVKDHQLELLNGKDITREKTGATS